MNMKTSSLRAIVKIFDIIAYSNIVIDNQRYIYLARLHQIIFKTRKTYHNFIKYIMSFDRETNENVFSFSRDFNQKNLFEKDFFESEKIDEKNFLKYDKFLVQNFDVKINVMNEMFFAIVNFDIDVDFELNFASMIFMSQSQSITSKKRKKKT